MTYYADKLSNVQIDTSRRFPIISATVEAGYDTVQLYQAGALVESQSVVLNAVEFTGALEGSIDPWMLLAVDSEDANTNFWDDAFPEVAANGNRINVQLQTTADILLGWRWRISIDGTKVYENAVYPNSDGAGGYGLAYGVAYGVGPFGAGYGFEYGASYGHGGGIVLEWVSEPQYNGTYAVSVQLIDEVGNVSTATTTNKTIETYPRPASDLTVAGYVSGTDTLSLSWTESEDL